MKTRKRLLVVDFSNLFFRGLFAHLGLSHRGESTAGLYGFMSQLSSTILETRPHTVVVCRDVRPYLREKVFPNYKADRKRRDQTPEVARAIETGLHHCDELLKLLAGHVHLLAVRGLEADDLIAACARGLIRGTEPFNEVVAASNDSDLYQLLGGYRGRVFKLYKGGRVQKGIFGLADFRREYPGLRARQWVEVILRCGGHNGLPHPKGVGERTALSMVRKGDTRPLLPARVWERNRRLTELPFGYDYGTIRIPARATGTTVVRPVQSFLTRYRVQLTGTMEKALMWVEGV